MRWTNDLPKCETKPIIYILLIVFKLEYLLHKKTATNAMMIPTNNEPATESPTNKPSVKESLEIWHIKSNLERFT